MHSTHTCMHTHRHTCTHLEHTATQKQSICILFPVFPLVCFQSYRTKVSVEIPDISAACWWITNQKFSLKYQTFRQLADEGSSKLPKRLVFQRKLLVGHFRKRTLNACLCCPKVITQLSRQANTHKGNTKLHIDNKTQYKLTNTAQKLYMSNNTQCKFAKHDIINFTSNTVSIRTLHLTRLTGNYTSTCKYPEEWFAIHRTQLIGSYTPFYCMFHHPTQYIADTKSTKSRHYIY